jgi:UDP-GlcNAc:undecaprenyl-phosphate GlcNAc-1-phosphate transferase
LIVLWIVLLTNALNLIDGLDGLACGVAAIAGIILFFAAFAEGPFVPILALALTGACLGFLRYNFFPARIFLGDTGSLFLGFVLAALSIQGSFKTTAGMALALPLVALLVPLADTVVAFFRRLFSGRHPFAADQRHVHHRLLAMGYSQTQAVLLIYALQINLGIIALVLKFAGRTLAVSMLILLAALMFVFFKLMEKFRLSVGKLGNGGKPISRDGSRRPRPEGTVR